MANDPIKHVIVLMFENHSFDKMLGCLRQVYPELKGVDPQAQRTNRDASGNVYRQEPTTDTTVRPDPKCARLNSDRIRCQIKAVGILAC